ncbi:MAG: translation elongation factor 4 [Candidatus Cloacimonetes bacterium]|nr:translation elongation factor 4 [Candidatus Cloacimonadota bacterium]
MKNIRNFCIIAHIDHGKSTLADRILEETHVVERGAAQVLDDMELEREKGITIKSHAVRMDYELDGQTYEFNLIDTPGHVDFGYEVSRSLASCEGALLVVDASQGIEAQTMSNLYQAMEHNLEIIPVINKIDMPAADIEGTVHELAETLGVDDESVFKLSAKTGQGVSELLAGIVARVPAPSGDDEAPVRALVFDSFYDVYRGVIVLVRMYDGVLRRGDTIHFWASGSANDIEEIGAVGLGLHPGKELRAGEVGYIIASIKDVSDARVGDTITLDDNRCEGPLAGYKEPKPMVYSGLFPLAKEDYVVLRDSLAKLKLNDASITYEKESSMALGHGFRCGFLGMLHLEIVKERLLREYNCGIITTTPSVRFQIFLTDGTNIEINNPVEMPDPVRILRILEPIMNVEIIVPNQFVGNIMQLAQERRGTQKDMQYIDEKRVALHYELPLLEIIFDFFDKLKSVSRGYASLDYSFRDMRPAPIVKVDIMINGERVDAMSFMCHEEKAHPWGKAVTETLRDEIPRHLFKIALQASIGSKIIARSTINAMRKNVTAKCYGGDITRKKKLLEKQKAGKKRMKEIGSVAVPQEAFLSVLRADRT